METVKTKTRVKVFARPIQVDCKRDVDLPMKRMTTGYYMKFPDGSIEGPFRMKALYEAANKLNLKLEHTK